MRFFYDILPYTCKDFLVRRGTKCALTDEFVVDLAYFGPIFMLGIAMGWQGRGCGLACKTDAPNLPQVVGYCK